MAAEKTGGKPEKSNWSLFVPIHNLEISKDLGGEIRIGQVTFLSSERIPSRRKRLGLFKKVTQYRKIFERGGAPKMFSSAKVYAFLKTRRTAEDNLAREFGFIRDAVYILASSQFYRRKRNDRVPFGSPEHSLHLFDEYLLFENDADTSKWTQMRLDPAQPYRLNKQWKKFLSHHFFPHLLKVLNGSMDLTPGWKHSLRKAAILAGQSQFARNLWEAFLYDMIALEVLLTHPGDRFPDAIIERLVAFFGWVTKEDREPWERLVSRLYDLRCRFIHDGQSSDLTIRDLIDADMILANLLYNLCVLTRAIRSKQNIVDLAAKLAARQTLGMRLKERPRRIRFTRQIISEAEYQKLENQTHWAW